MKKIGLIGGLSWESTQVYYQILNQRVKDLLGGYHSCKVILESLDFAEVEKHQHTNDWSALDKIMVEAAENLERAGAELILLCTNTMHLCADTIKENTSIPFVHIAEAAGTRIKQDNIVKVLLLGTKITMEKSFYSNILKDQFGIDVITPIDTDREIIHNIIYQELVHGVLNQESKSKFIEIIQKSVSKGANGVVLGCTEIPLLISADDVDIRVYDTTAIHAEYAIKCALNTN